MQNDPQLEQLKQIVKERGLRPAVDLLAEAIRQVAHESGSIPYNLTDEPDYQYEVCLSDALRAANYLNDQYLY